MEIREYSVLAFVRIMLGDIQQVRKYILEIFKIRLLFTRGVILFCRIIRQRVLEKINLKKESHQSVLQSILKLKEDDPMVAVTLIIDLFIAGIDTVCILYRK